MEAVDLIKLGFSGVMGLLTVQVGIQLYFLKRIVDQGERIKKIETEHALVWPGCRSQCDG